jgi:pullulanase
LIRIRREHPAFRMTTTEQIAKNLVFIDKLPPGVIAYTINGAAVNDKWKKILVLLNGNKDKIGYTVPEGNWRAALENDMPAGNNQPAARSKAITEKDITLPAFSCTIFYQ